ncbi:MAG: hypothetical protein AB1489_40610 [Acidobacteriota bacterium]
MVMDQIQIKTESFPVRCEICHQSDLFDATKNYCSRCAGVNTNTTYPASTPTSTNEQSIDIRNANKAIKDARIAGIVLGIATLGFALILDFIATDLTEDVGLDLWVIVDVALIFGLTYGIHRKNRACAVIMFLYYVCSKLFLIATSGRVAGLVPAIFFSYAFYQGIRGTFAYHKLMKDRTG